MAKQKDVFETTFNKYDTIELIGEGGAGQVWAGTDSNGEAVAIKVLRTGTATTEKRKRFKNEIIFCQGAKHPHIVPVIDHGLATVNGKAVPFLVMPRLSKSYRKVLSTARDFPSRLKHFDQMLSGVEAAHLKGVTHRDLKPENILYDHVSDTVMVADFGIATFSDDTIYTAVETADNARLANFQYAAPEQRVRGKSVDMRADIFALGLILNEMFTGEVPHGHGYRLIKDVAAEYSWLDDVVSEMIQSEPARRPNSIDAIKQMFVARRQDYVSRQRISETKNIVIPITDEDDPLALEGISLVGLDWTHGTLTLKLNRPASPQWIQRGLLNMGGHSGVMGYGPERFHIQGNSASIDGIDSENTAQRIIDHFKQWLPRANDAYRRWRQEDRERKAAQERESLQKQLAELEKQQRMRQTLRI